jgi:pimeloyl-ACP methyl ester carboxylesterase
MSAACQSGTPVPQSISGPTAHTYFSERLRLHYVDWGNEGAPPLLLIHGGRDHCRNWDWVAQNLRDDYHIVAPDLRGHGDSQWLIGSSYLLTDFAYDIAQLVSQKKLAPVTIIGHSLGGAISLLYTGLYPDTVRKVVAIEGLGPPPQMWEERARMTPDARVSDWISQLRDLAGRIPRRYASIEDAFARMQAENKHLTPEQARHLTVHGVNQNEDGTYSWKFDNYTRAFAPIGFTLDELHAIWNCIACPTLLVRGTESWAPDPTLDGRIDYFRNAKAVNVEGAGHWVHHDRLEEFLGLVRDFLAD